MMIIVPKSNIRAESQANWSILQLKHETSLFEGIMKPGDPG